MTQYALVRIYYERAAVVLIERFDFAGLGLGQPTTRACHRKHSVALRVYLYVGIRT